MTEDGRAGGPAASGQSGEPLSGRAGPEYGSDRLARLVGLIRAIEQQVPEPYRVEVLRILAAAEETAERRASPDGQRIESPLTPPSAPSRSRLNLSSYAGVLGSPGRTLLKALVALDATASQLGVDWMTPSEIERFLVDRARVPHVYRTNISNALRGARQLVDRRRRGRGYEYRITLTGREALEREQKVLGG